MALAWRAVEGDGETPSALVYDSRSLRSSPTAWIRGIDGGKLVKGVKFHAVVDKNGSLMDAAATAANVDDRTAAIPMPPRLVAAFGFQGELLGDMSYRGKRFAAAAAENGMTVSVTAGGRGGVFMPAGIRWMVERTFAWMSRYRRLNVVFDRKSEHFLAHAWIAFGSIVARRIARLQPSERLFCAV